MRPGVALLLVSMVSCAPARPLMEDSRAVRIEADCTGTTCEVMGSSVAPPACSALPDIDLFVIGAGSIAMLCGASVVSGSLALHDATCRPIVCASEGDCPQFDDRPYDCDDGWCTTSTRAPQLLDVVAACLSDVDRTSSCGGLEVDPATMEGVALAEAACDETSCSIPAECRR